MRLFLAALMSALLSQAASAAVQIDLNTGGFQLLASGPHGLDKVEVHGFYEGTFVATDDLKVNRLNASGRFRSSRASLAGQRVSSVYVNITEDPQDNSFDFYGFDLVVPGEIVGIAGRRRTLLGHSDISIAGFDPLDLPYIASSNRYVGMESDYDSAMLPSTGPISVRVNGRVRTQSQSDGFRVFYVPHKSMPEPTSLAVWGLVGLGGCVASRRR